MIEPILTIVMPVRNMERFIERTLSNLFSQQEHLAAIELIIVDDGSTDDTLAIIESFKESLNLQLISLETNKSIGNARNIGVSAATGQYIAFLDGDDMMDLSVAMKAIKLLERNNSDVCVCEYDLFDYVNQTVVSRGGIYGTPGRFNISKSTNAACWNKIYRSSLVKEITFPETSCAEDAAFVYKTLMKANRIESLYEPLILYTKPSTNPTSTDRTSFLRWGDLFVSLEDILHNIQTINDMEVALKQHSDFVKFIQDHLSYTRKKIKRENLEVQLFDRLGSDLIFKVEKIIEVIVDSHLIGEQVR